MKSRAIYLADMSRCRPAGALARRQNTNAWQVFSYETVPGNNPARGRLIYAPSYANAPEVVLPLKVSGWHHVFIGYWNPHFAYDGGFILKVKLASDPCFTRIREPEPAIDSGGTSLREVFFKTADLSGESLRVGQVHGPFAQKASIAYVKLVPLVAGEVAELTCRNFKKVGPDCSPRQSALAKPGQSGRLSEERRDKAIAPYRSETDLKSEQEQAGTRTVAATNDGISFFHANEYGKKEHLLELVEPYRDSDIGRVIWAVNYGDTTNYPSRVGSWIAGPGSAPVKKAVNSYSQGTKASQVSLRAFKAKGIIPENVVERHAHAMGLKFDAMFRLGILGHIPPQTFHPGSFVRSRPEFRQVTRGGLAIEKASFAFPAVRSFMLDIIRETAGLFKIDGAVLGFNRGPEFMLYEKPVLADYRREYLKRRDGAGAAPKTRRLLFLPRTGTAPHVDGCLDDECWKRACELGELKRSGGCAPRNATTVMAAFDLQNLYLAVRCAVADPKKLKRNCPLGEKSGKAWTDDCIDMKISADGGRTICQFIVSASGASWARSIGNEKWGSDWSAAVQIGEKEYTVEIAIPLRTIGITALKPGTPVLFNLGREDRAGEGAQESVLAEPYLDLCQAPLLVFGKEAQFLALKGVRKIARLDYADGRNVPFTDPVMQAVRCRYLTEFVRDARRVLDEVGAKKGRRLELGVWVYGNADANLRHGFDVETWMRERLIDSVIGFMSPDPADDQRLIQAAKKHGCRYLAGFIPWFDNSAQTAVKKAAAAYAAGVDGLAVWDIDHVQDFAEWRPAGRILGHADKVREWAETAAPPVKSFRLKRVAGYDVAEGLNAAVYSGG